MHHRFIGMAAIAAALVAVLSSCADRGSVVNSLRTAPVDQRSTVDHRSTATLGRNDVMAAVSTARILATNRNANSVTEYKFTANGNIKPTVTVVGPNTHLNSPLSAGLDGSGNFYVLNLSSITVFEPAAIGNAKPKFYIAGGLTVLSNPQGIAVDHAGKSYVTNSASQPYITVYAAGSNGDRAPVQTIFDVTSNLFVPAGIAVHGNLLYVVDQGDNSINEYLSSANGQVSPVNVINGVFGGAGIAVDALGLIYVCEGNSIAVYAANATGNAQPLRTISGSNTQLNGATGLSVGHSVMAVANTNANSINLYLQSGNGNIGPLREIVGTNTGLVTPEGVGIR